jgi:hypothetical protein
MQPAGIPGGKFGLLGGGNEKVGVRMRQRRLPLARKNWWEDVVGLRGTSKGDSTSLWVESRRRH